jgi:hypothetical protein
LSGEPSWPNSPNAGPLTLDLTTLTHPLAHHRVALEVQPAGSPKKLRFTALTDALGAVTFEALPIGTGTLSVWEYEVPAAMRALPLAEPRKEPLFVPLADVRVLHLRVLDSKGRLFRGVRVTGPSGAVGLDSSGIATVRGMPANGAEVTLDDDALGSLMVKVPATGDHDVTLGLPEYSIDVLVIRDGKPAPHEGVSTMRNGSDHHSESRHCVTGDDGRCFIGYHQPGTVRLGINGVNASGNGTLWSPPTPPQKDVELAAGTVNVELTP